MIRDYLADHILITDGATGTYYSQITGEPSDFCELANLNRTDVIEQIHTDYIRAGAKLIRTNTFAANPITLNCSRDRIREVLTAAITIAKRAVGSNKVYIAGNLGPIPDNRPDLLSNGISRLDEYRFIIDVFLENGITIFNFETLNSPDDLSEITAYIKRKQKDAFIITQFALSADGFTRKGFSLHNIINQVRRIQTIDAYGFNCGVGPTHLSRLLKDIHPGNDLLTALPNAGYPEIINERTVFTHNPEYFADRMNALKNLGVRILGGCCGTTPQHIEALSRKLSGNGGSLTLTKPDITALPRSIPKPPATGIWKQSKFIIAAELDPPFDLSVAKIIQGARVYKTAGVDLITIADSPMAKARVDSIAIAAKILRDVGIDTLPHLCCRDKNLNALKSGLLAAHIEGIRNILAVTGDPLPGVAKSEIKSVFNVNSIELIRFISQLNAELFKDEPMTIGGALNLNAEKPEIELQRMAKKIDQGATFFLTQPIFDETVINYLIKMKKNPEVKILAGILPIVNRRNALFLKNELPGMRIPDFLVDRFSETMDRETAEQTGVELATEIASKMKDYVDGFYFITPFNRTGMVVQILHQLAVC